RAEQAAPKRVPRKQAALRGKSLENRSVNRFNRPNDLLLAELTKYGFLQHNKHIVSSIRALST
ncbi:hypothetical protein LINPERHAP2_LOCUS5968, partial [Linum perenne]